MREKVDELKLPQEFIDPSSVKGMCEIAKSLAPLRKSSQALATTLAGKSKSSAFRRFAPEGMQTSIIQLRCRAEALFKVSKYMSQNFMTDADVFAKALRQCVDMGMSLPGHSFLISVKFSALQCVKLVQFTGFFEVLSSQGWRVQAAMRVEVDEDFAKGFLSGVAEACASRFFLKITAADVDADDGKVENAVAPVARLRSFYHSGSQASDVHVIANSCKHCFAILAPWVVDYANLAEAMKAVVSDRPGPYLKPLLSGATSHAILAKAVAVLEKREAEQKAAELDRSIEDMLGTLQSVALSTTQDGEAIAALFGNALQAIEDLGSLVDEKMPSALVEKVSNHRSAFDQCVLTGIFAPLAHEFRVAISRWCLDMRAEGKSEVRMAMPALDEQGKEELFSSLRRGLTERQMGSVKTLFQAQASFSAMLVDHADARGAMSVMEQAKHDILGKSSTLQADFGIVLPEDFATFLRSSLGSVIHAKMSTCQSRFAVQVLQAIVASVKVDMTELNELTASLKRMSTSFVVEESVGRHVDLLMQIAHVVDVNRQLVILEKDFALQPDTLKNIPKILDLAGNSVLMALRESCSPGSLAQPEALQASLEWAVQQLPSPTEPGLDVVDVPPDDPYRELRSISKQGVCDVVRTTFVAVEANYDSRVLAMETVFSTLSENVSALVSAVPGLANSVESQERFCNHINGTGFNKSLEQMSAQHMKIKKVADMLGSARLRSGLEDCSKQIGRGRGFIASFCSLALLANAQLNAKGKTGDGLRKQLKNTKALMDQKGDEYGDAVPEWLLKRVCVALGIVAGNPAGHASAEGDGIGDDG